MPTTYQSSNLADVTAKLIAAAKQGMSTLVQVLQDLASTYGATILSALPGILTTVLTDIGVPIWLIPIAVDTLTKITEHSASPEKFAAPAPQANGAILAALIQMLTTLSANPAIAGIVETLITVWLGKLVPVTPATT